jgi:ribose 5-phosphate isomerase A
MVVIADHTKRVAKLGKFPLPVEVVQFGLGATRGMIEVLASDAGCEGELTLRMGAAGRPVLTDSGNFILDCTFGQIDDPEALDEALRLIPGVVENGLFLGIADICFVGGPAGVATLERDDADASE